MCIILWFDWYVCIVLHTLKHNLLLYCHNYSKIMHMYMLFSNWLATCTITTELTFDSFNSHSFNRSIRCNQLPFVNHTKCSWKLKMVQQLMLLYFAWEDQRQKQHFICHKMPSVLYKKYSTVINKYSTVALISLRYTSQLLFVPMHVLSFYHLIHGFTKLSTTVNGWFLLLHDKWLPLAMCEATRLSLHNEDSPLCNV